MLHGPWSPCPTPGRAKVAQHCPSAEPAESLRGVRVRHNRDAIHPSQSASVLLVAPATPTPPPSQGSDHHWLNMVRFPSSRHCAARPIRRQPASAGPLASRAHPGGAVKNRASPILGLPRLAEARQMPPLLARNPRALVWFLTKRCVLREPAKCLYGEDGARLHAAGQARCSLAPIEGCFVFLRFRVTCRNAFPFPYSVYASFLAKCLEFPGQRFVFGP